MAKSGMNRAGAALPFPLFSSDQAFIRSSFHPIKLNPNRLMIVEKNWLCEFFRTIVIQLRTCIELASCECHG
jgi:hypothetical protein